MKKKIWMGIFCILIAGCGTKNYQTITASKAKEMMNEDVVILDVRTEMEYEISHIKDAVNIPLDQITTIEKQVKDKSQVILVYCQSGNRSKEAAKKLVEMGYQKVYNFGGISDWTYGIVSALKEQAELSLNNLIKAIEITYLESITEDDFTLPLKVNCDGSACTYGSGKKITFSGVIPTSGEIILNTQGRIEPTSKIIIKGYQCTIPESGNVICE